MYLIAFLSSLPPHAQPSIRPEADDDDDDNAYAGMPILLPDPSIHQRCWQVHRYEKRCRQCEKAAGRSRPSPYTRVLRAKHDQGYRELPVQRSDFDAATAYTSKAGAWIASRPKGKGKRRGHRWTLAELKKHGALHIRWDGRCVSSFTRPFLCSWP